MRRRQRSHLDEWASLLDERVPEESSIDRREDA